MELSYNDAEHAAKDVALAAVLERYAQSREAQALLLRKIGPLSRVTREFSSGTFLPFWLNGPFQPMYDALREFTHRIHRLKVFQYDFEGQWRFEDSNACWKLHALQDSVKKRAEGVKDRQIKEAIQRLGLDGFVLG